MIFKVHVGANFANLAVGKFGLRALAQSMARELGPKGVHVAHTIIDGQIVSERYAEVAKDKPDDGLLVPDAIAENYGVNLYYSDGSNAMKLDALDTPGRPK